MIDVDKLAQEIRRVDGNHSLGAGALAEALIPFLSAALHPHQEGEKESGTPPPETQVEPWDDRAIAEVIVSLRMGEALSRKAKEDIADLINFLRTPTPHEAGRTVAPVEVYQIIKDVVIDKENVSAWSRRIAAALSASTGALPAVSEAEFMRQQSIANARRRNAAERRVEVLETALKPFTDFIEGTSEFWDDDRRIGSLNFDFDKLKLGMFRAARAALAATSEGQP